MNNRGTFYMRAATTALLAMCLGILSSCVYSETITEIIYDQKLGTVIDYDVDPVYVSAIDAETTSDEQPLDDPEDSGADDKRDEELLANQSPEAAEEEKPDVSPETPPEQDEDATVADEPAPGVQDESNDSKTQEGDSLDEKGSGGKHDDSVSDTPEAVKGENDTDAPVEGDPASEKEAETDNPSNDDSDASAQPEENPADDPSEQDDESEGKTPKDEGSSDEAENSGEKGGPRDEDSDEGDEKGKSDSEIGNTPGATFDEWGAEDELPENVKRVAAVGNAAIAVAALGGADGDPNLVAADEDLLTGMAGTVLGARGIDEAQVAWNSDGTSSSDVDIDTLLGLDLDACIISAGDDTLNPDAQQALIDKGVNIVYVPQMNSPDGIVSCVRRVAALLQKGGDTEAARVADTYYELYDSVIGHVGNLDPAGVCALYIDEWRDDVSYHGPLESEINVFGIALAPVGSSASFVSTFLNAAGVVNPAVEKARYQLRSGRAVVWPFIGGTNDSDWSGISNVNSGKGTQGNDYELALTRLIQNDSYFDLGTPAYPALIASSESIKGEIENDRDNGGVYSARTHISSSIASDDYYVYVNPHGIFSSWADGSMESILEAAWASCVFQAGGDDGGFLEDRVRTLYSELYGFDLGEMYDDVIDGVYAE